MEVELNILIRNSRFRVQINYYFALQKNKFHEEVPFGSRIYRPKKVQTASILYKA